MDEYYIQLMMLPRLLKYQLINCQIFTIGHYQLYFTGRQSIGAEVTLCECSRQLQMSSAEALCCL